MILTEEEAKTKRCQEGFGQTLPRVIAAGGEQPVTHCIGSACMAWRWHEKPLADLTLPISESDHVGGGYVRDGSPYVEHEGGRARMLQRWKPRYQPTGYCGKAGKP